MFELTFNSELHEYRIDGQVVPSVTQILGEAGLIDDRWYTKESQLRGRTVHIVTALDDRGELDEAEVTGEYQGYLNAWRLFRADVPWTIIDVEQAVCHPDWRYAGRSDRRMCIHRDGPYAMLVDIKTGQPEPWHQLQTAAYERASLAVRPPVVKRYAVYLSDDGTYKLREHGKAVDWDVFLAALALANWKRNEGKLNGRNRNN